MTDPFQPLVSLFAPQSSVCDKTLIHCDYLTTVIHMRVCAETIGPAAYKARVPTGHVPLDRSYYGFNDLLPPP